MRRRRVAFRPNAKADLFAVHAYVAENAGDVVASEYIGRIEAACGALAVFPERGTRRHDLRPGIRIMGFERRAAIVFRVTQAEVTIVRIFHGGQDYERALRHTTEE